MLRDGVRAGIFIALAGCALLAACDKSGPAPDVSKTSASTTRKAPKTAKLAEQMVAAVSTTRSATVIGVYFSLGNVPTANLALPVDIVLVPHEKLARLVAHFDGQDGLTVVSGDAMEPKTEVSAESTLSHQLVLMPTKPGVFMISASIETESSEGTVSRVFSIPVIVSAPPSQAPAPTAETPATQGKPQSPATN
jgi:GTP:adenosylcobinamide-phosphate guanylyltransferase